MNLKSQDVFIALKLVAAGSDADWTYHALANELFLSLSETHAGIRRGIAARLLEGNSGKTSNRPLPQVRVRSEAIEEFLVHGAKYAFIPSRGSETRGMPTGYAAPCFVHRILSTTEMPPVWPDPEGSARGYSFEPLYKSVPKAAAKDPKLYELLALLDAIRDGRARERDMAINDLHTRIWKGW